ncbi:LacI family DNA-binding transcriptional regulator [Puniceicoccus vermicola]|uniref:LacI family DNA-binding transcriptional regulator n=1 Tax=Puniceicoccus vermicola TaxID=388746 RepID=A0A7X1AZT5_9BACT|nr:LacI family DNA-binding transcriptional regulator [Puniceicoccus vermicola]MBC2603011.1 LacI family DNA-binding transcriptional regulator [Puniceicoccus vermicola]
MSPSSGKVTMKDIAEAAGVSLMTVSRCLKNNPRQSPTTRKQVQQIARELGYTPHPYLSALMSNLAQKRGNSPAANLAVLHFNPGADLKRHAYFRGILARAADLGYNIEPVPYSPQEIPPARLREILLTRGVRGIILMPAPDGFSTIDFDFDGFAVAALGHTLSNPIPRVASDIYSMCFYAFDEVVRRGYRRIGLVQTEYVNRLGRFLYSGAFAAYREHVKTDIYFAESITPGGHLDANDANQIARWIQREKLDAVISPIFSIPVYQLLVQAGILIPEETGYLHLIDIWDQPEITQISQCPEFMGTKAVDMVVAAINRNEFAQPAIPHVINTMGQWIEGKTLPRRN